MLNAGLLSPYTLDASLTFAVSSTPLIVYLYATSVENDSEPLVKVTGIYTTYEPTFFSSVGIVNDAV